VQRIHGRRAVVRRAAARRTRRRFFAELPFLLVAAVVLTVLVKGFLIQAFFIPSRSMEPTLDVGDRVVVNRLAYRLGDPHHGQVVVFLRPTGDGQASASGPVSWVRRNDARVDEPYLRPNTYTSEFRKVRIKPGHYWVMGDNREDSADSRVFGQVDRSALVGRAVLTVWPVTHAGGL
jgi:signal peptidase I